ncbi:amidohydrolase family protein [Amycolatopsis aidingensis]|uniref:amidohydrolase family protein n=1 Tax=Amycolatopsis aidingensis TaxID=2842453 RepID=UPI001C0D8F53|nr:amidohydrolase family protein [Amycolatopsis aidingensis]
MLITVGQLLYGPAGARSTDAAVLVHDGKIVQVGPRDQVTAAAPATVPALDFPGATLLPGLIDGHVHLSFDAGADPVGNLLATDEAELLTGMATRAGQLLASGVTTVRDLGDRAGAAVRLRTEIDAGRLPGPRILAAVAPLTPPGGHCWFLGGEVGDDAAIRERIRRNIAAGADVLKVMVSGGHITEGGAAMWESQFTTAQLTLMVDEAARYGVPVAAHAHSADSIAAAVAAGVDTVEHCLWLDGPEGVDRRTTVARQMADRGIAVCGTLCGHDWRAKLAEQGSAATRAFYDRLCWLDELGVPLIAGTDAGIPMAAFDDYVGMLELYRWLGFSPERVLELATVDSAHGLGLSATTGRIAPGLDADLLVVAGDPATDLSALRAVRLVLAKGRPHHRTGHERPPRQPARTAR